MTNRLQRQSRSDLTAAASTIRSCRRKPARLIRLCLCLSLLAGGTAVSAAPLVLTHPSGIEVNATPNPVTNGQTIMLQINTRGLADPIIGIQAWQGEKAIPVYPHPRADQGIFIGFIGISYFHQSERMDVKLEWTNRRGYHFFQFPMEVSKSRFKKEKLRVPKGKVSPSTFDRDRIAVERSRIKQIYNTSDQSRLWDTAFALPAKGKVTSPFGSQRVLNGKMKSFHSGVDFRAPTGTPIYAANDGIVRLARNLFYSGNHLIIDHGLGIFTGYSHLSAFSVKPGDRVRKGQQIGLAGATGRTNGPHLHWAAKVNGVSVDPMQLTELIGLIFATESAPVTESK